MSVRVMSWVFEHSESTGNDRLVLLAIADRCDDDGGNCWKSTEKLAEKARVSKRTAQRCIDRLIASGELASVSRMGTTSMLSVVMEGGRQVVAPQSETQTAARGVKLSPASDCRGVTRVMGGASPVSPDTSKNHPSPQPPASGGRNLDHCDEHRRFRATCSDCIEAKRAAKARPKWCGRCNESSRLLEDPDTRMPRGRCPDCHPLEAAS